MTIAPTSRQRSLAWLTVPGFLSAFLLTDFLPAIGLVVGVAAAVVAAGSLVWRSAPRWVTWLAIGIAAGVAALFLLAWTHTWNPTPASGSGSSSAGQR